MIDKWPDLQGVDIKPDTVKLVVERADLAIAAQNDGLKSLEARLGALFAQSITLASAAIAAAATVLPTAVGVTSANAPPSWVQPFMFPSLITLSILWLAAAGIAANASLRIRWVNAGFEPKELYKPDFLKLSDSAARLKLAEELQKALNSNRMTVRRYARRLEFVIRLLAAGPIVAIAAALLCGQPINTSLLGHSVELSIPGAAAMLLIGVALIIPSLAKARRHR